MTRTKQKIKLPDGIYDRTEKRIVEVALLNPDLGAKRLVPILKRKKITATSSRIYHILKRHNLQTIEKRRTLVIKQEAKTKVSPKKSPAEITSEVEELIVDTSLQHPELGAKGLLSILNAKGIDASVSRIYTILRRNNLQNREKRFAAVKTFYGHAASAAKIRDDEASLMDEGAAVESFPDPPKINWDFMAEEWVPEDEIEFPSPEDPAMLDDKDLPIDQAESDEAEVQPSTGPPKQIFKIPSFDDNLETELEQTEAAAPAKATREKSPSRIPMATRMREKSSGGIRWMFRLVNLMLLVLIGYLGFGAVQNFRQAQKEIEAFAAFSQPPAAKVATKKPTSNPPRPPLEDYKTIWERNLFNVKEKEASFPDQEVAVEKIAPANKNIGIKLVGTVFSSEASLKRAIVYLQKSRKEETFREGDKAEKVRIKKILRNKVIIATADGDQLLKTDPDDFARRRGSSQTARKPVRRPQVRETSKPSIDDDVPSTAASESLPAPIRALSIKLKREQIEESLSDVDGILEELEISPFLQDDEPAGFIVSKIPRRSILTRMGLRNGYVVTRLNDQEITTPEQAAQFFETLAEGGDISFQIQRSRGTRRRARQINLSIE